MSEFQLLSPSSQTSTPEQPRTLKDRAVALTLAVIFVGLGAAMVYRPVLLDAVQGKLSGRSSRRIAATFELIWSRPVGVVAVLLGLLLLWGVFSRGAGPADRRQP